MSDPYLEKVKDPSNRRMRVASGQVDSDDPLVTFFYLLARDKVPMGDIEDLIEQCVGGERQFTNGWLALWAEDAAKRLQ